MSQIIKVRLIEKGLFLLTTRDRVVMVDIK